MPLDNIKHIVLILSGKGGVGKSSVTTQLALSLSLQGKTVGVLDVDLTGPSIPRFFGVEGSKIRQAPGGMIPVAVHDAHEVNEDVFVAGNTTQTEDGSQLDGQQQAEGSDSQDEQQNAQANTRRRRTVGALHCMSLGFVLPSRNSAVIWRGPKKTAMVRQFLTQVAWPDLDYLLIDTPPGTSDEHISLLETLLQHTTTTATTTAQPQLAGAVLVTTPQAISTADVRKELSFCAKTGVRARGVVENMAGFVCPHCAECAHVFGRGGGEVMAREYAIPFLGRVPLDPAFGALIEEGTVPVYPKGTAVGGMAVRRELGDEREGKVEEEDEDASGQESEIRDGDGMDSLAAKYTRCALFPLFDEIARKLVDDIESESP